MRVLDLRPVSFGFTVALLASLVSCSQDQGAPQIDETMLGVATVRPGFSFYPPWGTFANTGAWEPAIYPHLSVVIEELDGSGQVSRIVRTMSSATTPRLIRDNPSEGFGLGWDIANDTIADGRAHRLRVFAGAVELGRSDIAPNITPILRQYQNARRDLWIKFRVERTGVDFDGDGVFDFRDNCLIAANADQLDTDHDNIGNACECAEVSCAAIDECHTAGVCSALSGSCSAPVVADNTACTAENARPGTCQSGTCVATIIATCSDGVKNGDEVSADCGGSSCAPCADGAMCTRHEDCASHVCTGGVCQLARCTDLVKNGDETDVDCGGRCPRCSTAHICNSNSDCVSGVCADHYCTAPSCNDGVQNGDETGLDCGGSCFRPEVCNGIDDDCNGTTDEGLGTLTCGIGECQITVAACANGQGVTCQPRAPTAEQCDGLDNDCDGQIDQTCACVHRATQSCYSGSPSTFNVGVCRGGTSTCNFGAWASCQGEITPTAERCNNLDDDCNGSTDEGLGTVSCGVGACQVTVQACVNGSSATCTPAAPTAEQCDGVDNDCDGTTDEGCECINGQTRACYDGAAGTSGVGPCHGGTQSCVLGFWSACSGQVIPTNTVIGSDFNTSVDGWSLDNDGTNLRTTGGALVADDLGDGRVWHFVAPARYHGDLSRIYGGTIAYRLRVSDNDGVNASDSVAITGANGVIMRYSAANPTTAWSSFNIPVSAGGWINDANNAVLTEAQVRAVLANVTVFRIRGEYSPNLDTGYLDDVAVSGPAESCDGVDNDCDGTSDEGNPGSGLSCTTSLLGACTAGTTMCTGGAISCAQIAAPTAEICDGTIDQDCDGAVDEGCTCTNNAVQACYTGAAGTAGVGACRAGSRTCSNGNWGTCGGEVVPAAGDACDGVDNDCDGVVDEGCVIVENHFAATVEGWTAAGDGGAPSLSSATLRIVDQGLGNIWYFRAPAAGYNGNLSAAYGGRLTYRLRVSARDLTATDAVMITGANGVTMRVAAANPTTSFTTYNITLSTASAWIDNATGATMNEAAIRAVLANVTNFLIRGEYSSSVDTGYLDDVAIYRPN